MMDETRNYNVSFAKMMDSVSFAKSVHRHTSETAERERERTKQTSPA